MKIYISSPLYTTDYKYKIRSVVKKLRSKGYEVYSPMEYTVPNAWDLETEEWAEKVYEENVKNIESCDLMVALYYSSDPKTPGTSFEIGYAKSLGKKVITLIDSLEIPLMIGIASDAIVDYSSYHIIDDIIKEVTGTKTVPTGGKIGNNWNIKGRLNALS